MTVGGSRLRMRRWKKAIGVQKKQLVSNMVFRAWGKDAENGSSWVKKAEAEELSCGAKDKASSSWGQGAKDKETNSKGKGRHTKGSSWDTKSGGHGQESFRGRGDGEWKNNRNPRPADDPNTPTIFTMTRQRLDIFPSELQDVLIETEAVMTNIRRIMSLTEYSDGNPLPDEDQSILLNMS